MIVRYAEIGLKGNNRKQFEQQLVRNIKAALQAHQISFVRVESRYSRILVQTDDDCACLKEVFGISSFSPALSAGTTVEEAFALVQERVKTKTFRVSCQRVDKTFSLTSMDFCRLLGAKIVEATGTRVSLKEPETDLAFEILQGKVYFCHATFHGAGGLPVGSAGHVFAIVEQEKDLYAAWLMLKRGCTLTLCCPESLSTAWLEHYCHGHALKKIVNLSEIPASILLAVVPDTSTSFKDYSLPCPLVRPLIGMSDDAITAHLESAMRTV